ncbi:MAG: Crp/Fnr family transcriptional regulator [Mucilaginibacter sp.]|nr:Crp/Fnr family transcriptional regulator [Mucilaginibacter sp.]
MSRLILRNFALHVVLAPDEQEQILALLEQKSIKKRTVLISPDDVEKHIYFVEEGCLRMYHTDMDGQEHNLCFYPENWWACDNISFFNRKPAIYSIQALEDSKISYLTITALNDLFVRVPKLERFFRILIQNGFDMFQRRVVSDLSLTAEHRYLEFRRLYPGLEQRINQKHIASYLGITAAFLSMMRKEKDL